MSEITERQDFSRLTLRSNLKRILDQYADAHPSTLLDKVMAAIPVGAYPPAKPVEGDAVEPFTSWDGEVSVPEGWLTRAAIASPQPGNDEVIERAQALLEYDFGDESDHCIALAEAAGALLTLAKPDGERERLIAAFDLARNRLRAAAINEAPSGGERYYEYSQWADEADASLAALNPVPSSDEKRG